MTDVHALLTAALGPSCLKPPPADLTDISRHALGTPLAWVTPSSTAAVQQVVRVVRDARVPLLVCGRRTAYWRPLDAQGAVVLDTSGLTHIHAEDLASGWVHVGAGIPMRALDDALRTKGWMLPCHPDAFGETSIGSSVSADMSAGIGMGNARVRDMVLGLTVVLGTGEIVRTGAAHVLGGAPFTPCGIPDLTGLFTGAEGRFGVITEVVVAPWKRQAQADLTWRSDKGPDAAVTLSTQLPAPSFYTTLRAECTHEPERTNPDWTYRLIIRSPVGLDELGARATLAQQTIQALFQSTTSLVMEDTTGSTTIDPWLGPVGAHDGIRTRHHFAGLDVVSPLSAANQVAATMKHIADDAMTLDYAAVRQAVYAAPGRINFGLHMNFNAPGGAKCEGVDALMAAGRERLSTLPVVPYRFGRDWRMPGVDAGYLKTMAAIGPVLDPDGLLQAGVGPRR